MMGKREYKRWDYDDETEITMEEHLTLEESTELGGGLDTPCSATFPQPTVTTTVVSPVRRSRTDMIKLRCRKTSMKEKAQLFGLSAGVLLVGFIAGFAIGTRDRSITAAPATNSSPRHSKHSAQVNSPWSTSGHDGNEMSFHKLISQINGDNIKHYLKRMSQEEHTAGTPAGRSMAIAIRDLWRSCGLSVRMEQHKTLLTKTTTFNYAEAVERNGSVIFTSSQIGDDVNLPNARPLIAFSPPANLNGTLVYGHYGRSEDFKLVQSSGVELNGSIALIRFGSLHPSKVADAAAAFGLKGIIFYPDPQEFGPILPAVAIKRASLLTIGQVHEFQKHKGNWSIPAHTIGQLDAERLLKLGQKGPKAPKEWQGGLKIPYHLGGLQLARLRIFNEQKSSSISNVLAAIPGIAESDRYVIVGCAHDSWTYGAGEPGVGLAIMTEMVRVFAAAVAKGWRPRRSILFVSWDANLYASSGVSHWLQEHHFEIGTRAIAYIDMTRPLQGNQTLHIHSSPLLKEVARRAVARVKHASSITSASNLLFSSVLNIDESSFAFLGNLGIPFLRLSVSNSPKDYDYPFFHTAFDTFDNFMRHVDSNFKSSEAIGKIISEMILQLADSAALPFNLEDYLKEIQKGFDHFMADYQEDIHKANLSIAYLQASVMRLEVIGDNFKTEIRNRTAGEVEPAHKPRRNLYHRIVNEKLLEFERAFLTRNSADGYKHQVIGFSSSTFVSPQGKGWTNSTASSRDYFFPKVREALDCGRRQKSVMISPDVMRPTTRIPTTPTSTVSSGTAPTTTITGSMLTSGSPDSNEQNPGTPSSSIELVSSLEDERITIMSCHDWRTSAAQKIASLVRSLDAASAVLQSPLLPEDLN